ncbi:MAG: hypothetical protein R2809_03610 [Flavobacteriales bacterium]
MKRQIIFLATIVAMVFIASCTKEEGEGGYATIKGKINKDYRLIPANSATYQYTVAAADEDVYIVYGDNVSPSDRIWTNYDGEFEFKNLRKGNYTIYVYSEDTTGQSGIDASRR